MENIQKMKRMAKLSDVILKYGFEELFDRSGVEKFIPKKMLHRNKKSENTKATSVFEKIRLAM